MTRRTTDDSGSEPSPGVEVSVAAEPTVDSLAGPLEGMDTSPRVREPLPSYSMHASLHTGGE